jgi:hypothetical protein
MRPRAIRRITATALLAALPGAVGCATHYHYYGNAMPPCDGPPGSQPVVVQAPPPGAVCEVPVDRGPTVITAAPPAGGSQVVISQPQGSRGSSTPGGRYAWRKPEPESMATTRIEGGIDESAVR